MFAQIESLLVAQSLFILGLLIFFAVLMARKGLFVWYSAGFWTWAAMLLYFVLNPLASMQSSLYFYHRNLLIAGGMPRAEWVGLVLILGLSAFFITYLVTGSSSYTWGMEKEKEEEMTLPMLLTLAGFLGVATMSLLIYRTGFVQGGQDVSIQGGRFVGNATGYEYVADTFYFVPTIYLLISRRKLNNIIGYLLVAVYVALTMTAVSSRFTVVSMMLAFSMVITFKSKSRWPHPMYLALAFVGGAVLILRGHTTLESSEELMEFIKQIPSEFINLFSSVDSAMLSSFYLESHVRDNITGYDYALPLINYLLFGFIPSRLFPQKYFLVDWLRANQNPLYDHLTTLYLFGSKSSLIGSFYGNGGIIGVILLMMLMGFLLRKIDGMVSKDSHLVVRAVGVTWTGFLWMIWGSHDYWGAIVVGVNAIPAIFLWLFSPKIPKPKYHQINRNAPAWKPLPERKSNEKAAP
jgi:oligosaccharide repeat unit polymerase